MTKAIDIINSPPITAQLRFTSYGAFTDSIKRVQRITLFISPPVIEKRASQGDARMGTPAKVEIGLRGLNLSSQAKAEYPFLSWRSADRGSRLLRKSSSWGSLRQAQSFLGVVWANLTTCRRPCFWNQSRRGCPSIGPSLSNNWIGKKVVIHTYKRQKLY